MSIQLRLTLLFFGGLVAMVGTTAVLSLNRGLASWQYYFGQRMELFPTFGTAIVATLLSAMLPAALLSHPPWDFASANTTSALCQMPPRQRYTAEPQPSLVSPRPDSQ